MASRRPPRVPSRSGRPPASSFRTPPPPPRTRSYSTLPSLTEWQIDTRPGRSAGHDSLRGNDPILRNIDGLLAALGESEGGEYLFLLGEVFFSTMSWLNHHTKDPRMVAECRMPILSLNLFAANDLARVLECPLAGLAARLQGLYGVGMSQHGVDTDQGEEGKYLTAARREIYRVFIVLGRACHYRARTGRFKVLHTNTGALGDLMGAREGLGFVLSMSNELYAGPLEMLGLQYHSYFMGGRPVQCAGTLQFSRGVVTYVRNDSGHYKPRDETLVKVLRYLRMNGMDLSKVTVCQEQKFKAGAGKSVAEVRGDTLMGG